MITRSRPTLRSNARKLQIGEKTPSTTLSSSAVSEGASTQFSRTSGGKSGRDPPVTFVGGEGLATSSLLSLLPALGEGGSSSSASSPLFEVGGEGGGSSSASSSRFEVGGGGEGAIGFREEGEQDPYSSSFSTPSGRGERIIGNSLDLMRDLLGEGGARETVISAGAGGGGAAAPLRPGFADFTPEEKARLREDLLMVGDSPMQSAVESRLFTTEELRAHLTIETVPQMMHYWRHVAEILRQQILVPQLSDGAKIKLQELRRSILNRIRVLETEAGLALEIRPPPRGGIARPPPRSGSASGACPCPDVAIAIQELATAMGASSTAATVQPQIDQINQNLAILFGGATRRAEDAEARANEANAANIVLQRQLRECGGRGASDLSSSSAEGKESTYSDRIYDLENQLRETQANAAREAQNLSQATEARLAQATNEITGFRTTIDALQRASTLATAQHERAITLKDSQIAGLTANITTLTAQIAAKQEATVQSATNASSVVELRQSIDDLTAQLRAATTAHAEERAGLEARLVEVTNSYDQQQATVTKCNQDFAALQAKYQAASGALRDSSTEDLAQRVTAVVAALTEARGRAAECDERLEATMGRIAELEAEIARIRSESNSKTEEMDGLHAQVADLKAASNAMIAAATSSSETDEAAKTALKSRLKVAEDDAVETAEVLVSLRRELDATRNALDLKNQTLETATQSAIKSNQLLSDVRRLLPNGHDLKDSIQEILRRLEATSAEKTACEAALNDKTTRLEQNQSDMAKKVAEIEKLQTNLEEQTQRSDRLNDQLKAAQEKTAANVAAARATATTAQQQALDEMQAQLGAATDAAEKARTDYEISTQLKDGNIANLEAQLQHYKDRCGNVLQKVAKIDRAVEERSRASSIDASSGAPRASASAAVKAPVPGGVGRGGGTNLVSAATTPAASLEGVEFAGNPLRTKTTSPLPSSSGKLSGTNLFRRFGLGGATRKNGRKVDGDTSLTSNPMFATGAELSPSGKTTAGGGSKSVSPIPIKSGIRQSTPQSSVAFGDFTLNPLRATTSPTPETASVSVIRARSPPAAPGGKSSAQSTGEIVLANNPYADSKKLKAKKGRINYKRKTRKNRK